MSFIEISKTIQQYYTRKEMDKIRKTNGLNKEKKNYFCPRKVISNGRSGSLEWVRELKRIVVGGNQRGLGGGVGEERVLSVPSLSLPRTTESEVEKVDFGEIADWAKVTRRQ